MKSFMRCSELAHERQKTNLAEPLTTKSWSACTAGYFIDWPKIGVFQHNRLEADLGCSAASARFPSIYFTLRALSRH